MRPEEKLECSSAQTSNSQNPTSNLQNPKDGVFNEPPKAPPKGQVWIPKPNELRNPLDTMPPSAPTKDEPKQLPKNQQQPPRPQRVPQPRAPQHDHQRSERYHCEFCHRDGHLVEFCFRRRRVERHEREFAQWGWYNSVHEPPRRGER